MYPNYKLWPNQQSASNAMNLRMIHCNNSCCVLVFFIHCKKFQNTPEHNFVKLHITCVFLPVFSQSASILL